MFQVFCHDEYAGSITFILEHYQVPGSHNSLKFDHNNKSLAAFKQEYRQNERILCCIVIVLSENANLASILNTVFCIHSPTVIPGSDNYV